MPFFCYNKNDYCDHNENCDDCDELVFGRGGKQVPSNADRIRSMTDEELAHFLDTFGCCQHCSENERLSDNPLLRYERCDEKCLEHCMEWLQQPAEE